MARARLLIAGLLGALALPGGVAPARADDPWGTPKELKGIEIEPRLGAQVPLDAPFRDEQDAAVRLGDYFDGRRPVVLVLAYYKCPMLCGLVLEATTHGLKQLEFTPGKEYQVLTVSIDQRETSELARRKKESVLGAFARPGAEQGWHFLTGSQKSIAELAAAVGFNFRFLPERNDFAHAAGIFVLTPDGRVSQTITGLGTQVEGGPLHYDERTLRLSLVEAADGKIGSLLDQILLTCFHYDPKTGTYTPVIMNIVRLAGAVTVILLASFVGLHLRRERRQRAQAAATNAPQTQGAP